ncbi:hypothetical protein LTR94_024639 [Friedmanniomyces endolithicus]|nr:hypothetical protein LTR94_024639 [Friedmanniomyces endolithicus]
MDEGFRLVGLEDGAVLISTDADARPPVHWVSANLRAIARGADLVGGALRLDPVEPIDPAVARLRRLWDLYWATVRRIEDQYDPRAWDPSPRHGDHTGASLAIRAECYRDAGGLPPIPTGEDRALVASAEATGARLRHPLDVWTYVSPRLDGRASAGMAQDMARLAREALTGDAPRAPHWTHWQLRKQENGARLIAELEPRLAPMPHDARLDDLLTPSSLNRAEAA